MPTIVYGDWNPTGFAEGVLHLLNVVDRTVDLSDTDAGDAIRSKFLEVGGVGTTLPSGVWTMIAVDPVLGYGATHAASGLSVFVLASDGRNACVDKAVALGLI